MKTDSELLSSFLEKRSQRAFRELVDRHLDWVYSVALRQVGRDEHLAKDVCQEVFASLARKAARLGAYSQLNGWLFRATRFAASDIIKGERRRRERESAVMENRVREDLEEGQLSWESAGELLDEAIDALEEEDRIAVTMRFFQEKKYSQIGDVLGIGENGARMRVTRAVDKLHGILSQRGIASTAAAVAAVMGGHLLVSAPAGLAATLSSGVVVSGMTSGIGVSSALKLAVGLSCGVAAAGIGFGLYQNERNGALEAELAALRESRAEQVADSNVNEKLDTQPPAPPEATVAAVSSSAPAEITHASVEERWRRAQELHDAGKVEEAFAEYLWLLDVGMVEVRSFSGVRGSFLLRRLVDLSEELPEAKLAMRERRDRIENEIQAVEVGQSVEHLDLLLWANLNRYLGEGDRLLAVYDDAENKELMRGLQIFLRKEFLEAKRYEEVYQSNTASRALMIFTTMRDRTLSPRITDPERVEQLKVKNREYAINSLAETIEIVAGAKQWVEATELSEELLAFDSSPETVAKLQEHLERAGGERVLETLLKENL